MKNNFFKQKIERGWPCCMFWNVFPVWLKWTQNLSCPFLACGNVWLEYMKKIWPHIGGVGEERFQDTLLCPGGVAASLGLTACDARVALSLPASCSSCRVSILSSMHDFCLRTVFPRSLILLETSGWMCDCHKCYLSVVSLMWHAFNSFSRTFLPYTQSWAAQFICSHFE